MKTEIFHEAVQNMECYFFKPFFGKQVYVTPIHQPISPTDHWQVIEDA